MAEETEQDAGAEASGAGVDPAAVALALNAANIDPSIAEDARAFRGILCAECAYGEFKLRH